MMVFVSIFLALAWMSFIELFTTGNKRFKSFFAFFMIATLLVLTTIRGGTRGDYVTYKEVYTYMTDTSFLLAKDNFMFEPLYSLLQWICKKLVDNFQFFLLTIGTLVISLEHMYAKKFRIPKSKGGSLEDDKEKNVGEPGRYYFTIFFVLWGLYAANIFVIRSVIATMICMYSTQFIENKKFIKFLLCVAIATGFHYSALVFLPAYFIFRLRSRLSTKLFVFVLASAFLMVSIRPIAMAAANLLGGTVATKMEYYLNATDFLFGTNMSNGTALAVRAVLNIGVLLIVGIYFWRFNKNDEYYEGYFNLYIVGCILYIATLTIGYAFARLSIYYNIFQIPLLMYVFKSCSMKHNKVICWIIFVSYIATRFIANNAASTFITYWQ